MRSLNTQLAARDAEKALILREVHHRIKNNMGTVGGPLSLQAMARSLQGTLTLERGTGTRVTLVFPSGNAPGVRP